MVSIPKVGGVVSCGFLLCLGLSSVAQADNAPSAADEMKTDQSDRRQGGQMSNENEMEDAQSQGGKTIKGEVLRVEGDDCVVKGQDGKEVRLHIDQTTQMSERNINQGDLIEAKVNDQNHALSIQSPDRRNDKATDSTLESDQTGSIGQ